VIRVGANAVTLATSDFKKFIEGLASEKAPGPATSFSMFHILYALELMAQKPIGRNKLAEKLGVGDGAIRTIVHHLQEAGLIETAKAGMSLTPKGAKTWRQYEMLFPKRVEVEKNQLTHSAYNFAILAKGSGGKVRSGIEQRDAAIMGGAKRAIAIVCRGGHLVIDSISVNIEKEYPDAAKAILRDLTPEENDVIIIAGSDDYPMKARRGAFAAAWVLLGDTEKE
jgi:DNA-binding MarR family transcriptional regulator